MTRPTKEQIENLAAWAHWKKRESGLSESDQEFVQAVSAILEEIDALNANQCTGCCYQAESVDCDLRELAELRTESATLRHEFKMLQAGAKRQRDALREARVAMKEVLDLECKWCVCGGEDGRPPCSCRWKDLYKASASIDRVLGGK